MSVNLMTGPGIIPEDKRSRSEDKEFYRSEKLKDHLHVIFTVFIYIAFSFLLIVFAIRLMHLVFPSNWYWLESDQVQTIDKVFFSGAIGSILGGYFKEKIGKHA
jgi:hypothetical protein